MIDALKFGLRFIVEDMKRQSRSGCSTWGMFLNAGQALRSSLALKPNRNPDPNPGRFKKILKRFGAFVLSIFGLKDNKNTFIPFGFFLTSQNINELLYFYAKGIKSSIRMTKSTD